MRVKPTEMKLVSAMLAEPAEDADSLAEAIIRALDEKRRQDDAFYAIVTDDLSRSLGTVWTQGPYPTRLQARKALDKARAPGRNGRGCISQRLREDL